jgi:hypothetical protein|tara:strand:- start:2121 stop:2399 length:279 start_codon:yes stop_codon:yes gene_type:complete
MIKIITLITLVTLVSACSSSAPGYSEKAAANDKKYEQMAKDKNMVCEFRPTTGSHRKKRTCMSKELSDEVRRRNQEALRSQQNKGQTSTSSI